MEQAVGSSRIPLNEFSYPFAVGAADGWMRSDGGRQRLGGARTRQVLLLQPLQNGPVLEDVVRGCDERGRALRRRDQ